MKECFWCDREYNTNESTAEDKETYCSEDCENAAKAEANFVEAHPEIFSKDAQENDNYEYEESEDEILDEDNNFDDEDLDELELDDERVQDR